jgi:flagellar protein FliL
MAEEKAAEAEEAPKKKGKLLLIIVAAVLVLTIAGGAAYYFLVIQPAAKAAEEGDDDEAKPKRGKKDDEASADSKKHKKKKKKKGEKEEPPAYLVLEPFTVNLADTEQEHFLQVSITLQVPGEAAAEEMKKQMAMIRDRTLKLLSSMKSSELRTVEGKQKLADALIDQIAEAADNDGIELPEISKIFFTAFIIQ